MQKLTDLRFVIGIFFSLCGLIVLLCYFMVAADKHPQLNLYAGAAMLLFGLTMLVLFYKGDAEDA